jgi:hypothetical protein
MKPAKCSCGRETQSFYDVIGHKGLLETVTACPRCFNAIGKGLKRTKAGDLVRGEHLIRYYSREHRPMGQINWLFWLAEH